MSYTIDNPKLVKAFFLPEEDNFTGVVKDKRDNIAYYENGELHRTDGPAFIARSGYRSWHIRGKYHREDGHAFEYPNGEKIWYYNDEPYGINDDFTIESWKKKCMLEIFK